MIRYDRLWKTMEDKELTQYRLIKQHGFSAGEIGRRKKNMHVSTHTIDTLCTILQCGIGDIMEFCPDETSGWTGPLPAQTEEPAADKPKAKKAPKGKTAVSTHTIDTLCTILQCGIGDIMEFCPDETSGWTGPLPAQTEEPAADKPKAKKAPKGKTAAEKPEKAAKKADKSGKEKLDKDGAKPLKAEKEKAPKEKKSGKGDKAKKEKGDKKGKGGKKK